MTSSCMSDRKRLGCDIPHPRLELLGLKQTDAAQAIPQQSGPVYPIQSLKYFSLMYLNIPVNCVCN